MSPRGEIARLPAKRARRPAKGGPGEVPRGRVGQGNVPRRYRVSTEGRRRVLRCNEAPTISVLVQRGFSATAHEAPHYPPGSIFLDGAAQGPPFLAPERAVYNLDHHEGCVRAFTLATCEQAMVLIRRRLDLRRRDWTVYANDADLDTVLAIWVLTNHLRLVHLNPETRDRILPLLRLEGTIDAQGLELEDLCGLSPERHQRARDQMTMLREEELALKQCGRWEDIDLAGFIADRLSQIDRMIYEPGLFDGVPEIEELARTEIADGSVAVVCDSEVGVYETEQELRRVHGDRLALFALRKGENTYTLRQVDPSAPVDLEAFYARLNLLDPASGGNASANRWGGSDEIGGSPRRGGTGMTPRQILEVCRRVHTGPGARDRLAAAGLAALGALGLGLWAPALLGPGLLTGLGLAGLPGLPEAFGRAAALMLLASAALLWLGRRTPGLFGLRRPGVSGAWRWLPLALGAAALGGSWWPPGLEAGWHAAFVPSLMLAALGAELLFRGCIHGLLAAQYRICAPQGRLWLSLPVVLSALLYAAVHVAAGSGAGVPVGPALPPQLPPPLVALAGALVFGLVLGIVRERSESVVVPIVFHGLALLAAMGAAILSTLL